MIDSPKQRRVLLHNMTLKGIENVPGVLNFDQRAIVISRPGDTIVTREAVDEAFLDYLAHLGYNFDDHSFIHSGAARQTYDSIFREADIIQQLSGIQADILDTYHVTELEGQFATTIQKQLLGNVDLSNKYGTKSGFRELATRLGIPIAKGVEHLTSAGELSDALSELGEDTETALVRLDEGLSGAGNFLVDLADFRSRSSAKRKELAESLLQKLPQRLSNSGATAEVWINNVESSPSLQYIVDEQGVQLLSTHDQVLEGKEKWYVGCIYPSQHITEAMISDGKKFMCALEDEGFSGYCGLDLIITPYAYYFVEANIRKPGTTYPREFVRKVYGTLDAHFYYAKDIASPKLIGMTFSELNDKLRSLTIKNKSQTTGVLIYNTGALREGGRFDVVAVSEKPDDLAETMQSVTSALLD